MQRRQRTGALDQAALPLSHPKQPSRKFSRAVALGGAAATAAAILLVLLLGRMARHLYSPPPAQQHHHPLHGIMRVATAADGGRRVQLPEGAAASSSQWEHVDDAVLMAVIGECSLREGERGASSPPPPRRPPSMNNAPPPPPSTPREKPSHRATHHPLARGAGPLASEVASGTGPNMRLPARWTDTHWRCDVW